MATALKGVTLLDADDPLLALSLLPEYRDRRPPFPFQAGYVIDSQTGRVIGVPSKGAR